MSVLSIDLETFSDIDLIKCGVYAYTASDKFEILLMAYAFESDKVQIVDIASGEKFPDEIIVAIQDETITKTAYNAQFERTCLSSFLKIPLSPVGWSCTAVQAAMLGLPLSLAGVAQVLGQEQQKMREGKDLIRYFCIPCKPTFINGNRTRNLSHHEPEKWRTFKDYCIRDVEVEMEIRRKIAKYPIIPKEQEYYILDQQINDRGVLIDRKLVGQAIACDKLNKEETFEQAQRLTGLNNPNSVAQLKGWLLENGVEVESLSKKVVTDLAKESDGEVEQLLNLRLQLAKTSIKKYEAMDRVACPDDRVRGLFRFHGANRSGRWSSQLIQVQNLPQNHERDLTLARDLLKQGSFDELELFFENVPNLLSELIRTAFIPKPNHRFIVADFSAIEARIIAWLAGEKWRMDVFATHGKIYEASASQMFKVPIEEITKGSPLRQKGKIAELALGFGGGAGALTAMGALEMGVEASELQQLVTAWRIANPNITKLWWDIDKAAIKAVKDKMPQTIGGIHIEMRSGILFITLPSGRKLSYIKPRIEINKFGREGITYEGIGTSKQWCRIDTYGPKLVENIVQAAARDLLAESMVNVAKARYKIVMHVHDEIIIEAPMEFGSLNGVCDIMAIAPNWAKGLPLRADGFECDYYRKD
ncbi:MULTISPECIES: DNA polymerase [Clostridium]|uniref:DNA-directed DNA polymerase n=1 Tax=Clostridium frigoriphilum TaxID=443253 RepID=A0ABU7UPY7_9CLOT|nr:DNA polymerase [Clostridium sp. DSM 17811]MBU3100689.1 DNA polymerase [Clostridium sp. DSM 17811]